MNLQFLKKPANFSNSYYYQKFKAKSKFAILTASVLIATFFISLLATQVFALNFTQIFISKSAKNLPQNRAIKVASATGLTAMPQNFNPVALNTNNLRIADSTSKPTNNRSETVISIKTNHNANPYKLGKQVQTQNNPVALPPPVVPHPASTRPSATLSSRVQTADNDLQTLTNDVVSKLKNLKQQETSQTPNPSSTRDLRRAISALVSKASSKGKSNDYVKSLIDDALNGKNAVPTALANANGKLDTKLLLTSVLPKTNAKKFGNTEYNYLKALEIESQELNRNKKIKKKKRPRYHIVKRGENLSKISHLVYGDPLSYLKIYRANRSILANINAIDIGQRLVIPR